MALTDDMLRMIFKLSQDLVVDVKISVARFVNTVCGARRANLSTCNEADLVPR